MTRYQPFYCEENVWWLLHDLGEPSRSATGASRVAAFAVFITNRDHVVPVWEQRVAPPGEPAIWDYHVIAVIDGHVYDLDSRLGAPVPFVVYLAQSFPPLPPEALRFAPIFRVVPSSTFLARFASDRSHMRTPDGWRAPPPDWPPPQAKGVEPMNLPRFLDPDDAIAGELLDRDGLQRRLGS